MTLPVSFDRTSLPLGNAPAGSTPREQLKGAAKQFEAIFLRQMLASARKADFGGEDLFGGQGEDTFKEMLDARFAEVASDTGALGMAASLEKQLAGLIGPEA